jgi:DNA primase
MASPPHAVLEAAGHEVAMTHSYKVFFPRPVTRSWTRRSTTWRSPEGVLRGSTSRPIVLKGYLDGVEGEPFFQKGAPALHPEARRDRSCAFPWAGRRVRSSCPPRRSSCGLSTWVGST